MTQYVLQAHKNEIDLGFFYHSGYDLITYHDDGRVTIESLDLMQRGELSPLPGKLEISHSTSTAQIYEVNGKPVIWGDLSDDNAKKYNGDVQRYLDDKKAATAEVASGEDARDIFKKMQLDGIIRSSFPEDARIDYDIFGPNCNTWTDHMDKEYLQPNRDGRSVFDDLGGKNDLRVKSGWIENIQVGNNTLNDKASQSGIVSATGLYHLSGSETAVYGDFI